jgi:hypothetical protein
MRIPSFEREKWETIRVENLLENSRRFAHW